MGFKLIMSTSAALHGMVKLSKFSKIVSPSTEEGLEHRF